MVDWSPLACVGFFSHTRTHTHNMMRYPSSSEGRAHRLSVGTRQQAWPKTAEGRCRRWTGFVYKDEKKVKHPQAVNEYEDPKMLYFFYTGNLWVGYQKSTSDLQVIYYRNITYSRANFMSQIYLFRCILYFKW